ncbi:FAD-dependent monooxygenase [Bacillus rhizoplanae]|uniref:FAD-dependent monooxygenase n=1 Tax=Bacillus rhizoplanae TaxID=2880966 RepID=UPI003D1E4BBA
MMSNQNQRLSEVDVLIVGAGPTGLTLASELRRFGVDCKVIDKASGISTKTKALGVMARTLEHLERMGIAYEFVKRGHPTYVFNARSENITLARLDFKEKLRGPYPFVLMIPQNITEDILYSHFINIGGEVQWRTTLSGFKQDQLSVEATIVNSEGVESIIKAKYLIGCDGAHSVVRHGLNIDFEGITLDQNFALADLTVNWDLPHDELYAFVKNGKFTAYFPMKNGQHRIMISIDHFDNQKADIRLDQIQQIINEVGPKNTTIHSPTWQSTFRVNQRKVKKGSVGRIFLAGDAAHIHSPIGAQGMNTGMQDAFNLAWKITYVLKHQSSPSLLDTYTEEREPIWLSLVKGTERATKMILNESRLLQLIRNIVAPKFTSNERVKSRIVNMLSQLAINYRYSRIVEGHMENRSLSNNLRKKKSIYPGDRSPDGYVDGVNRLFKLNSGKELTILLFSNDETLYANLDFSLKKQAIPYNFYHVTAVQTNQADIKFLKEQYGFEKDGLVVIRPDGYVGFISDTPTIASTLNHLKKYS